jgi:MoxR-like ATPase
MPDPRANQLKAVTESDSLKSPSDHDAVLELKVRIGKSVLGQDHLQDRLNELERLTPP